MKKWIRWAAASLAVAAMGAGGTAGAVGPVGAVRAMGTVSTADTAGIAYAAAAAAAAGADAATLQAVYRCGNEYRDEPCANGTQVDASDPRSAAQRADARAVVAGDKRLAAEMERDRRLQQSALKPARAASLSGTPAPPVVAAAVKPVRKKRHAKAVAGEPHDFVAIAPGSGKKGPKAAKR